MTAQPFKVVEEEKAAESASEKVGFETLRLGLFALSQRTTVALSKLFSLLTAASAFALWWGVLPNPSVLQLVGLGGYAVFILAINLIVRKP
jgi:hypothetical protein